MCKRWVACALLLAALPLARAELVIGQVAPLSGVLASTGKQMVPGGRIVESLSPCDLGGIAVSFGPNNRIGSRFVEVTVIGSSGKLLK